MTVYGVIVTLIAISSITGTFYWYRMANRWMKNAIDAQATTEAWEQEFSKLNGISHNYLNACRLIAIHRNGRVNVFTFARGDKNFTIETMGMLSDLPQMWRELAGLQ